MTDPKRKLIGVSSLGKALDERIKQQSDNLDIRHTTGSALPAPVGTSGVGGSGPATPESYVESLRLTDGGTQRSGNIVLKHGGVGALAEDTVSGDRRFTWTGKSVLDVGSLPGSPEAETIYHLTTDDTLHWYDGTNWQQLAFVGSAITTPVATKTAAYTATINDGVLLCSGTWTLSLLAVTSATGLHLLLRNTGAGTITLDPDAGEQIEGANTYALNAGNGVHLVCDGSAWWIVASL